MCYGYYHDGVGLTAHPTALASEVPGGVGFILSAGAKEGPQRVFTEQRQD